MFTGIIQALGSVEEMQPSGGDLRVLIVSDQLDFSNCHLGDSICVNGVCLTAVEYTENGFYADVSNETITCTSFSSLSVDSPVNLEKSLTPESSMGGHIVSGHVDGVGQCVSIAEDARSTRYEFAVDKSLGKFIATKGSITIDGTSLTVNAVRDTDEKTIFDVNIVPHTTQHTIIGTYLESTKVNIEIDVIARYTERMLQFKD